MLKYILGLWGLLIAFAGAAMANPACAVCAVAIVGGVEALSKAGVPHYVSGPWIGAAVLLIFYISAKLFEKFWRFWGYGAASAMLALSSLLYVYPSLGEAFGANRFTFSLMAGAAAFGFSQDFYQHLKERNGGRAHFPFEKVAMALAWLGLCSLVFYLI